VEKGAVLDNLDGTLLGLSLKNDYIRNLSRLSAQWNMPFALMRLCMAFALLNSIAEK
jgi:hypothetical protein